MNKYVIKNCPAFVLMRTATSGTYFNICGIAKGHVECKDCTDCVMKQIANECANSLRFSCERILAEKLLGLLDIQECG